MVLQGPPAAGSKGGDFCSFFAIFARAGGFLQEPFPTEARRYEGEAKPPV